MRKYFALFAAMLLSLIIIQCSGTPVESPAPPNLTAAQREVISASNKFAFDIFKQICNAEADTNIFVSPLSISYALGMTYNGAANETKEAMGNVLGFGDLADQEINESYKDLTKALTTIDPKVMMEIANSIWYRQGFEVQQEFIDLDQQYFDAMVAALDFADPQAAGIMNDWIAEKTHDKITDVIQPPIDPMTVMFLINAIYFKGSWTYEFDKNDTRTQPFYMSNSSETDCDMMKQENVFSRYFNQEFQAVDLPYGNAGFSMAIFLPRQDKSLDDLISQMNENTWKNWLENFSEDTTILYLPKFRMEYNRILNDDLTALGMGIAFDKDGADFSRINPFIQLFISRVIHKTFVQVDEKGTEASAVTVVEVGFTSGGQDNYMTVNRPFIFVIHDNYTGSILFMGKITNPIWEE